MDTLYTIGTLQKCNATTINKTEGRYKLTTVCSKVRKVTFTESISRVSALLWLQPSKGKPFKEDLTYINVDKKEETLLCSLGCVHSSLPLVSTSVCTPAAGHHFYSPCLFRRFHLLKSDAQRQSLNVEKALGFIYQILS